MKIPQNWIEVASDFSLAEYENPTALDQSGQLKWVSNLGGVGLAVIMCHACSPPSLCTCTCNCAWKIILCTNATMYDCRLVYTHIPKSCINIIWHFNYTHTRNKSSLSQSKSYVSDYIFKHQCYQKWFASRWKITCPHSRCSLSRNSVIASGLLETPTMLPVLANYTGALWYFQWVNRCSVKCLSLQYTFGIPGLGHFMQESFSPFQLHTPYIAQ